jgi:hypothetical protein
MESNSYPKKKFRAEYREELGFGKENRTN